MKIISFKFISFRPREDSSGFLIQLILCHFFVLSTLSLSEISFAQSSTTFMAPERIVSIKVIDGNVVGAKTVRLIQGERIELNWTTNKTLRIHLHGYDIEKVIKPSDDTAMLIEAYATGRYPITMHDHSYEHNHQSSEKTLIYLEVHPQ